MKALKKYFNISLILMALVVLPGAGCKPWEKVCETFKCCEKSSSCCQVEDNIDNKDNSEALITVDGKPVFTENDFENLCEVIKEGNPQTKMVLEMYPTLKCELFEKNVVPVEIAKIWAEKENKFEDPKIKEQIEKACQRAYKDIKASIVITALQEEVVKGIDKSDKALEIFYNENKSSSVFQNHLFLKKPVLINALEVEFDKEEDANQFLEKAKAENADFNNLAKEAKKEVKELNKISSETKDLDRNLILKLTNMKANEVNVVKLAKDKFVVVKVTEREEAEPFNYSEIKGNKQLKDTIEKVMLQKVEPTALNNKLEDIKKKYNIKVDSEKIKKDIEEMMKNREAQAPSVEDLEEEENSDNTEEE